MADRWMAEITYRTGRAPAVVSFEEMEEIHDIVERGPCWDDIDQIVITLNRPTVGPRAELARG